ncbi:VOC family protein [Caulobacter sp. 17J65-9]|uniref:VOC family protein n=1 Tax=Caulobacter sp. 17J65-9 TaxID=2709382 RepID=UPI0013CC090C|nr:VOC family protein [Caulobacter sp. 17J65-9]NEX92655.1 VOC family protein [Caulobacter sp. 17J65-9]
MISYVTIGHDDLDKAMAFYDPVLAALGCERKWDKDGWAGYGSTANPDAPGVMLATPANGQPARAGNGVMVGLHAPTPAHVDAFHAAAMANGGTCEGAPGPRPQYGSPNYYLAYVRDPVGNKLAAYCTTYQPA